RGLGRRVRADQGRPQDAGLGPRPVAQRVRAGPRGDRADPAELDRQAAVGRARAGPGRHRLAALLRGARRGRRRLRRPRPRDGRPARARPRPGGGGAGAAAGGRRGVQAPAVRARNEDQPQGVRTRQAAARHQQVAGDAAHRPRGSGITLMTEPVLYGGTSTARVRVHHLQQAKERGEKWAMLTAYDTVSASVFEEAGIPVMLVGDSAGNVVLGLSSTVPVTVDDILLMTKAVTRSTKRSLIVADMPFGSYESGPEQALATAVRLMKEGGAQVTKELAIPTIGIGAGVDCDAQVLVWPDMAGLTGGRVPKFVKKYAD